MNGVLCLQGGREFHAECDEMDRQVLERSGSSRIVVLAGAARVGGDHDGAVGRATRHYARFGVDGRAVPDPRTDRSSAIEVLSTLDAQIDLVVLPGGSPSSLLTVLRSGDGCIGELVVAHHRAGGAISGASAGAMVMCSSMARPDRNGALADGLGLVDGVALPHWSPGSSPEWDVGSLDLWGLPECGGALVVGEDPPIGVGRGVPARCVAGVWEPLPRSH